MKLKNELKILMVYIVIYFIMSGVCLALFIINNNYLLLLYYFLGGFIGLYCLLRYSKLIIQGVKNENNN